ncbi:MAG: hypothetical protein A3I66_02700 [Burkholderiales bacterium RIFCSPLOWO2_02_FULL_57_36]|nr:MAG: hypothetical protein A3I66_02700 [Burkholderiales bacterium RIFCSPLOWO2_02_FULL_57_36]
MDSGCFITVQWKNYGQYRWICSRRIYDATAEIEQSVGQLCRLEKSRVYIKVVNILYMFQMRLKTIQNFLQD